MWCGIAGYHDGVVARARAGDPMARMPSWKSRATVNKTARCPPATFILQHQEDQISRACYYGVPV